MIYRSLNKCGFIATQNLLLGNKKIHASSDDGHTNATFRPMSKMGAGFNKHLYKARQQKGIWTLWFYKH
jgi:hypothetical protein